MLLENLMEEKQLDLSQPFLSVRRTAASSTTPVAAVVDIKESKPAPASTNKPLLPPLSHYKPDLKSGPIRVPGTVPFVWERSPGRPKNNETATSEHKAHLPPVAPRLPPGKRASMLNVHSDAASSEEGSSSPAAGFSDSREGVMEETRSEDYDDDDDDEYERFVDALDTLSRTESSLLNCSISGISGLDGVDMRPNRTLSSEFHAKEFMIGRFLPAAQAMANESPQYSPQYPTKKQPVLREQARQITTLNQPSPSKPSRRDHIVPYYAQCDNNSVDEDDDDYSEPDTSALGVCGFFPSFCLQNRLNPVPGIRTPASSFRTRRDKYDKAAEHGRRVMNEPPRRQSGNRIDDSQTRSQPADPSNNAGWSHNYESSQPNAFKAKGFLGVPAERHNNKGLETMGSILAVKEVISFAELLAHDDLEWESRKKTLHIDSKVSKSEEKITESIQKSVPFGACDRPSPDNVCRADVRRDQNLMLAAPTTLVKIPPANEDRKELNDSSLGLVKESTEYTRRKLGGRGGGGDNNTRPSQRKPCPLPLPLPKSPSESWLKKALPTVSSRTQMSKSPLGMILMHHPKEVEGHNTDPTWETIVKSSGEKNRRFQFSEQGQGQLTPIPEA